MLQTVYVCTHALERWRERAAPSANAPEEEVIEVLRQSKRLAHDDFLPLPRKPNTHYYHNAEFDCYFVVEPIDLKSSRVVTVITPGPPINPVVSKKKKKPTPPEPNVVVEIKQETPKPDVEHEYLELVRQINALDYKLSGLTKKSSTRQRLVEEKGKLHKRLLELKPVYKEWKRERAEVENKNPFRVDGSLNYAGAIMTLMEKVESLESEVAQLRAALKATTTTQPVKRPEPAPIPPPLDLAPHLRIALEVLGEA